MKLEIKKIVEREVKLKPGWTVKQEVDDPALYSPNVSFLQRTNWSEWEEQFTWLPKKSIYGKIVWGKVQHRHEMNAWGKVPLINGVKQWATNKEVFESKLRGDRNGVDVTKHKMGYTRTTANGC